MGAQPSRHIAACPALYPLQRQPGDEKDTLTRLTAHVRTAWHLTPTATLRLSFEDWENVALDLISEARQDLTDAHAERHERESELSTLRADLAELDSERLGQKERGDEMRDARDARTSELKRITEDLVRAKALVTTLSNTQSDQRAQALAEGREQGHMDALQWLRRTNGPKSVPDIMVDYLAALMEPS